MTRPQLIKHASLLAIIFLAAACLNSATYFLSGIPAQYVQSSDATVHVVTWQQVSSSYQGEYDNDVAAKTFQAQSTGELFADRVLVRIADTLHINLLTWSIIVSALALAVFLSGVYALVLYTTKNTLLAFLIALLSIAPVISLGLSSWGFMVQGFVPKEISLALAVWLSILYFKGIFHNSACTMVLFFFLLGLLSNWYPVLFFHYALVLLFADVIWRRRITKEQILFGVVFLIGAPVALYDIFIKASSFVPPDLQVIVDHYAQTLHSWQYLFFHYLRKQIIYGVLVGGLWYIYRKVLKKEYPLVMGLWFAIWWSSLILSLIGVGIEVFAPLYTKYLLSRVSVWFYFVSMILVSYTAYETYFAKVAKSLLNYAIFFVVVGAILLSQTSILNVYSGVRELEQGAQDYKDYLSIATRLHTLVPMKAIVLANPDDEANALRTYAEVPTYVSWKDGNVTLYDGAAARAWEARYKEAQAAFATKDFAVIKNFATKHDVHYYLVDKKDIQSGIDDLYKTAIFQAGSYALTKF
jgi:hypothetical protein